MVGLFLGAGFSKWAAELPLARDLFDFAIRPWGPKEARRLELVRGIKEAWDAGHPDGLTEQFIGDALRRAKRERRSVLWYVARRLSEPYIWEEWQAGRARRHVLMLDEHRAQDRPGVRTTQCLVRAIPSSSISGIITTNYDMLVEYALGSHGFHYGQPGEVLSGRGPYPVSQYVKPVMLTGHIRFAKLHGSLSWDEQGRYTEGRRGLTGDALIVPPVHGKPRPPQLAEAWSLAEQILGCTRRLVVFGFAFNPYDADVLDLLRHAGRRIESVLLVDPYPPEARVRVLWPTAKITSCPPPPVSDHRAIRDLTDRLLAKP